MPDRISMRSGRVDDEAWLYGLHERSHRTLVEAAYGPYAESQQRGHEVFRLIGGTGTHHLMPHP